METPTAIDLRSALRMQSSRRFLLNWILANAVASIVSALGLVAYHHAGELYNLPQLLVSLIVTGLAPWFVLRSHLPTLRWQTWVWWTAVAGLASLLSAAVIALLFYLALGFSAPSLGTYVMFLLALVFGEAVFGLIQWRVLRRFLPRLQWWVWVLANASAYGIAQIVASLAKLSAVNTPAHDISEVILAAVAAIADVITGLVLVQQLWVNRPSTGAPTGLAGVTQAKRGSRPSQSH